eukprot:s1120_g7.t1
MAIVSSIFPRIRCSSGLPTAIPPAAMATLADLEACGLPLVPGPPCLLQRGSAGSGGGTEVAPGLPSPAAEGGPTAFTCMSYNVLLPNSQDGWWIYKYYRDAQGSHTEWPQRQGLMRKQIQQDKKGRMRPATCWRPSRFKLLSAQHKDRSLILALQGPAAVLFVVNVHLTAGPAADRRLRQATEALEAVEKDWRRAESVPIVFCGDFNSQGSSAVRQLLTQGQVLPEFRESGDPTERGQEGKQITSKVRKHSLATFQDAAEAAGSPQATILVQKIDEKMKQTDGSLTPEMQRALDSAFERRTTQQVMNAEEVEKFLLKINRKLGRGSEFRFVEKVFETKGKRLGVDGKFWGVEHDLRELLGHGMADPSEGPCELRFDYVYFTPQNLTLQGVQQILTPEQLQQIHGEPYETLPNHWHPSDHLPVIASFELAATCCGQKGRRLQRLKLDEEQWMLDKHFSSCSLGTEKERFSEHEVCVDGLRKIGHTVRFGVDAREVSCASYSMVMFNFPAVSMQDCKDDKDFKPEKAGQINGELILDFLKNAQATCDPGTLLIVGLWGRCDGLADRRLYGQDAHELIASALSASAAAAADLQLEDALSDGFLRSGVHADYNFYKRYTEETWTVVWALFTKEGYAFRSSSGSAAFEPWATLLMAAVGKTGYTAQPGRVRCVSYFAAEESSHKEWHLQACFVLKAVAAEQKKKGDQLRSGMTLKGAQLTEDRPILRSTSESGLKHMKRYKEALCDKVHEKDLHMEEGKRGVSSDQPVNFTLASKEIIATGPPSGPPSAPLSTRPVSPAPGAPVVANAYAGNAGGSLWLVVLCFIILDALKPILVTWANQGHAVGEPSFIQGTFVLVQTFLSLLVGLLIALGPWISDLGLRLHPEWRSRLLRCLDLQAVVRQLPVAVCLCLSKLLLVYSLGRLDAGSTRVFRSAMQPCDPSSAFFGFMGVTSALVFANLGAAYGTAKSGVGIASMGVMRPDMIMKSIIPVVMAGVLGIYGLITAVIINGKMDAANYSAYSGYAHLGAGLTVGMSSLAAGLAIGIVGDAGVRANAQQPRLFVGMILILIFAEALGLYGLIVGLVVASTAEGKGKGLCTPYA